MAACICDAHRPKRPRATRRLLEFEEGGLSGGLLRNSARQALLVGTEFAHHADEFRVLMENIEKRVAALTAAVNGTLAVFGVVRRMPGTLSLPPDTPNSQHFRVSLSS